ncbi:MAG: CBS domain-containing protein [Bdellovibrionota bacterium]
MRAREIMSKNPVTIKPEATLREAAEQMSKHNVGALPVYDGKSLRGIVTDRDLTIRGIARGTTFDAKISTVMTEKCVTCSEDEDLNEAVNLMEKNAVRRLVVMSTKEKEKPIGIFSLDDIGRKSHDANSF